MEHLVRILNDNDRQTLAWLRRHVGDARLSDAARRLIAQREQHGGIGSKPYLSAVCRYLGVRPPAPLSATKIVAGNPIADQYLSRIREVLAQHAASMHKAVR
ncbi:hypothetical protein G3N59_25520 [Paraburkholderia sp. Ac-20340]|uniref:hypothetical protein n=1 Tax=Paraburkholderia sp. Ac-20340 TaxID=2703888 RepID=UPI00197F3663|nr:hypothetical protein [Paraburkholderia sp. Ac-20340]MBN3856745.1 hypothetical protein [Paraburkholderia sp. Ac-20340]